MKRVLFISPQPYFQWRGSPIRVMFDVRALAELGYEVDLLTLPIGMDHEVEGVRIIRVANMFRVKNIPIGPSAWKLFFDVFLLFKGLGLARRRKYAVIHGIEDAGALGAVLKMFCRSKLVFEKHSDPGSYKKGGLMRLIMWAYTRVEHFSIRRSDAMIGTGIGLVEQAREVSSKTSAHHIFDIPSSLVDPGEAAVSEARNALQQSPDEILALYVGSFAVYQGIDLMFDAIVEAVRKDARLRFVIVGGTPEQIDARRAWLREREAESAVTFAGKIHPDELPHTLAAADILLSPRISGTNSPLKLLDYAKVGRAIVATDIPSNRFILDEETAVLVPPEPGPFAEAICSLAGDPEQRDALGRGARRLIDETYNFDEFKRRLKACYDGVLGPS